MFSYELVIAVCDHFFGPFANVKDEKLEGRYYCWFLEIGQRVYECDSGLTADYV